MNMGRSRDVVAVWRPSGLKESPVFVAAIGPRSQEAMLGGAVLALAHLGIDRPRIRSIQRVAGDVGGIERGEHNLGMISLHKISCALDIKISKLIRESGY